MNIKQLLTSIICLVCLSANAATGVIPDMKFRRLDARDGSNNRKNTEQNTAKVPIRC